MDFSPTWVRRYHVFPSFHGPDVRRKFLSHLHNQFASKGITVFKDQEIKRGHTIGPELKQAIQESRISIVVLSKKYASSSWCLDELVEILKCKEDQKQIVMTIFYEVNPSDVRKQTGNLGSSLEKTCEGKTEDVKQRWSKALTEVAHIKGEHSLIWEDEAKMIENIVADVSNKLNVTPSKDFDRMVGMETHLTTIARAIFDLFSTDFQHKCFMGNLKGNCGSDDYGSKLYLQNQLLSKILDQKDMRIHHLGAIQERLHDQRVLIVLDDLEQLDALAKEPSWFGLGSRIFVTTEDRKILNAHWVHDIYHVGYPSEEEALEILCQSAFQKSSPWHGFEEVAKKVTKFCGSLRVVGSSLRGESRHEWERQLSILETSLDRKIDNVLRVGFNKLSKKDQSLFLHIAFFFNNEDVNNVTTMLAESNLDIRNGLKTLTDKSLVHISTIGWIQMHCLLQKLGRQVVHEQSDDPGKRQFLADAKEIQVLDL